MRARVVIGLGCLSMGWLVAAAACVPDFAYRDGADGTGGAGNADGDGGDRPSRGGGGGAGPGVVAVAVGATGGPSVGPGPGPGPGASTTGSTGDPTTTGPAGAGGQGDGGASTTATTSTGGDATTTSTSTGGTLVDDGAPCWDGLFQEATSCVADQVCCYDADYYAYHTCDTQGFCGDWAYELQCNDAGDCGGDLCCVNVDGSGYLESITCESSCDDFVACSALVPCPGGQTCRYVFNPESSHDEYDAYGFCDPG